MNQYFFDASETYSKTYNSSEFEYLFFFLEDSCLYTNISYSDKYLDFLKNKFNVLGKTNKLKKKDGLKNYWFFENQPKELLSKCYVFNLIKELSLWDHQCYLSSNITNLSTNKEYLFKPDEGFSGIGIKKYNGSQLKGIVEEKLDRVFDFSYFFDNQKRAVYYETLIDEKLQFKGSTFSKKKHDLKFLLKELDLSVLEYETFYQRQSLIQKKFQEYSFNVDCFVYRDKQGKLRINACCEINFRKSMGLILYKIYQRYFFDKESIRFDIKKDCNSRLLYLTPTDSQAFSFFVSVSH